MDDQSRRDRARSTFDRAVRLLLDHDMAGFAGLWAPNGTMTFPFASGEQPTRLDGRAAVAEDLRDYTDLVDIREVSLDALHHTDDADTVVVEFAASGVVVATGRPYRLPYVAVITVGEDGITGYRDYWDLDVIASSLGTAPASPAGRNS